MDYIFIDTNIYIGKEKRIKDIFYGADFANLTKLLYRSNFKQIVPEVCDIELNSHIQQQLMKSIEEINKACNSVKYNINFLSEYSMKKIKNSIKELLEKNINESIDDFFKSSKRLSMDKMTINPSELVRMRYNCNAPFESKPEKQNEYQDIFIADCLTEFLNELDINDCLVVISNDKGFREYLKNQINYKSNCEFYDSISKYISSNSNAQAEINKIKEQEGFVKNIIQSLSEKVCEEVKVVIDSNLTLFSFTFEDGLSCDYDILDYDAEAEVSNHEPLVERISEDQYYAKAMYKINICGKALIENYISESYVDESFNISFSKQCEIQVGVFIGSYNKFEDINGEYEIEIEILSELPLKFTKNEIEILDE